MQTQGLGGLYHLLLVRDNAELVMIYMRSAQDWGYALNNLDRMDSLQQSLTSQASLGPPASADKCPCPLPG